MVSGISASPIGMFLADPWMLKMENVAKDLYQIEPWDSYSDVLRLASSKTVSKRLGCKFNDFENCARLIFSLTFIRLRSISINARELSWQDLYVYQWATLLWFFYFNTPMSTMLPNKRNILPGPLGDLFLFPRSDVSERSVLLLIQMSIHMECGEWFFVISMKSS